MERLVLKCFVFRWLRNLGMLWYVKLHPQKFRDLTATVAFEVYNSVQVFALRRGQHFNSRPPPKNSTELYKESLISGYIVPLFLHIRNTKSKFEEGMDVIGNAKRDALAILNLLPDIYWLAMGFCTRPSWVPWMSGPTFSCRTSTWLSTA